MIRIVLVVLAAAFLLVCHDLLAVEGEEESSEIFHISQVSSDLKGCDFTFLKYTTFDEYLTSTTWCHKHLLAVGNRLTKALLGAKQPSTELELVSVRLYYRHADRATRSFCGTSMNLTEDNTDETISCSAQPKNGGKFSRVTRMSGCKMIQASCGDRRDTAPTFVTVKYKLLPAKMGVRQMTLRFKKVNTDNEKIISASFHHRVGKLVRSLTLSE